jgi:hypothetical protein
MLSDLLSKPVQWRRQPDAPSPPQAPRARLPWPWLVGVGGGALLLGAFLLGLCYRPCSEAHAEREQIQDFLRRGQRVAIALAENVLVQQSPRLCAEARRALASLWYSASLDDLFLTPANDEALGPQTVLRWRTVEQRAEAFGLPRAERLPPTRVAQRAYAAGLWPLADAALREAFEAGELSLEGTQLRYATLTNWGYQLAFQRTPPQREQAVRLLATAQALATAYRLPSGEACLYLRQLGYADCTQPAPDVTDPMLAAARR